MNKYLLIVLVLLHIVYVQSQNVGIGTNTPNNKLEITSPSANTSGLRFTNLTSTSATVAANGKYLSVNATGDVILTPAPAGSGPSSDWSLSGNAGTIAGTNFIGTTDSQDLIFKRNNILAGLLGNSNTAFGVSAFLTGTGSANVAIGVNSLQSNTIGGNNIAIGYTSLQNNTSGFGNISLGNTSLSSNTTGNGNVSLGNASLMSNLTGNYNVSLGYNSLSSNTTGYNNISLGFSSLKNNTVGGYNISFGSSSMGNNTVGTNNISMGYASLAFNSSGSSNISIGNSSLFANTISNSNISIGNYSMYQNTVGEDNLSIGESTLFNNTSGKNNIALGYNAMYNNLSGSDNLALGYNAMRSISTGSSNIVIGKEVAFGLNTGGNNILVGNFAGAFGLTSGNNNIIIGNNSSVAIGTADNQLSVGNILYGTNIYSPASGRIGILTNAPTSALSVNGTTDKVGGGAWGTYSDARVKKNVVNYTKGLKEILQIRPVSFQYNGKGTYTEDGKTYVGVIAQEIEDVLPSTVTKTKLGEFDDLRQYDSSELLYTLINAVKEQQQLIQQQQLKNEAQQKQIELQEDIIQKLLKNK